MNRIRIGVVGTGRMGKSHCRVYANLRHAELVGVYDQSIPSGQAIAQANQVLFFDALDALLSEVDAVSIATPTPTHFELATHCLKQGKHVLIEKPMTHTLAQAQQLVDAARAHHGLVVQVGHIERFNPAYRELKNLADGATVIAVDLRRLSPYRGSNTDVDVVLDLMIHDIDLALNLAGEYPIKLTAHGMTAYGQAIDYATAQLQFASGMLLSMTASRLTEQKVRVAEVTALEAFVTADLLNKSLLVYRGTVGENVEGFRGVKYRQENVVEKVHVPAFEPLHLELQDFVDCVMNKHVPQVSAQDGLNALRMAHEIRETIGDNLIRRNL